MGGPGTPTGFTLMENTLDLDEAYLLPQAYDVIVTTFADLHNKPIKLVGLFKATTKLFGTFQSRMVLDIHYSYLCNKPIHHVTSQHWQWHISIENKRITYSVYQESLLKIAII